MYVINFSYEDSVLVKTGVYSVHKREISELKK